MEMADAIWSAWGQGCVVSAQRHCYRTFVGKRYITLGSNPMGAESVGQAIGDIFARKYGQYEAPAGIPRYTLVVQL